jgi:hypothetical protein
LQINSGRQGTDTSASIATSTDENDSGEILTQGGLSIEVIEKGLPLLSVPADYAD